MDIAEEKMKKNCKYYLVVIIEKLSIYLAIVVLAW